MLMTCYITLCPIYDIGICGLAAALQVRMCIEAALQDSLCISGSVDHLLFVGSRQLFTHIGLYCAESSRIRILQLAAQARMLQA